MKKLSSSLILTLATTFPFILNIQANMPTVVATFQIAASTTTIVSNVLNILKHNRSNKP